MTPIDHTATSTHPLDPLSPDELERSVVALRRAGLAELGSRVISVDLLEPDKAALRAWREGGAVPQREALAVVLDIGGEGRECTIALDGDTITDTRSLAGMQPAVSMDEYFEAGAACRRDAGYREALARRGIEGDQVELVHIEPWTVGSFEQGPRRMARCLSWLRSSLDDVNPYGRPLGGLVALVDLTEMRVLRVDDHGTLPVPDGDWDYRDGGGDGYRDDQRPIEITQPEGPSFTLHGRELRWQRWRLRVGFSHRESLVLHEICYEHDGEVRPICHRASIAELVIPYGDPNPTVHFKNVFDIGEYGVGPLVNALELGCDCVGDITYLDAACVNSRGEVDVLPNAICIHEEDYGILWKHHDDNTGRTDVARSRRLVISCITTVGNYEYGFFWYLYQDGGIQFEGKLTGIVLTAGVPAGEPQRHATEIAPGVAAGYHQHFFTARLDMDVDGERNVAFEVDSAPEPAGPDNPEGIGLHHAPPHVPARVAGETRRGAAAGTPLAGREPGPHQPHGRGRRLRAGAGRQRGADGAARLAVPAAGRLPRPPPVGDALPPR